jgi:glutathione peroxidase
MKKHFKWMALGAILLAPALWAFTVLTGKKEPNLAAAAGSVYDFKMKNIDGKEVNLADYKGKVLVIVNVASKCGLTPQYESLEAFYKKYQGKGVEVLGFPANNFMGQEPGTEAEIKQFCSTKYGVTFPMFGKISVKGSDMHPLYKYLTEATGENVSWNFQKFLVNKDGKVVQSFSPRTKVDSEEVIKAVEALL